MVMIDAKKADFTGKRVGLVRAAAYSALVLLYALPGFNIGKRDPEVALRIGIALTPLT